MSTETTKYIGTVGYQRKIEITKIADEWQALLIYEDSGDQEILGVYPNSDAAKRTSEVEARMRLEGKGEQTEFDIMWVGARLKEKRS